MNPHSHTHIGKTIVSLQEQLAERDKVILEQQARNSTLYLIFEELLGYWMDDANPDELTDRVAIFQSELIRIDNISALEAHDREVRIKTLEDAAKWFAKYAPHIGRELRRMANELKEQS